MPIYRIGFEGSAYKVLYAEELDSPDGETVVTSNLKTASGQFITILGAAFHTYYGETHAGSPINNYVTLNADDDSYIPITPNVPNQAFGMSVKIETIEVCYYTDVAGSYIDNVILKSHDLVSAVSATAWNDSTNVGSGVTGYDSEVYTVNEILNAAKEYHFELQTESTAGDVRFYGLIITWSLTDT